ncbi:MAG: helical backbone metal receptor [Actinocrinis sp.]
MRRESDDQGTGVQLADDVRRIVSLVPSLTEAVACSIAPNEPDRLVGVTNWCTHPPSLAARRIGGTKNPDVAEIVKLRPDVVLANEEENRQADLDALRAAGIAVWVTEIRTVPQALASLDRMLVKACALPRPEWLDRAKAAWSPLDATTKHPNTYASSAIQTTALQVTALQATAIVPIWRRPWMVLGRDTFAGDVLRRLGVHNLYEDHADRYPAIPIDELCATKPQLVILPDEPYKFTEDDGPEAFPGLRCALVSGRHLTWYGPSLAAAPTLLRAQL